MKLFYEHDGISIYCGDSRELIDMSPPKVGCLIIDPPWDDDQALNLATDLAYRFKSPDLLVFTDPRRMGTTVWRFGPEISWVFTWDTMNSWATSSRRPVQQTKFCLWYGDLDRYDRDRVLWGTPPPERHHPSTTHRPLDDGRRFVDLWRESLRWLHHPGAGAGSTGSERFRERAGDPAYRHAKPTGWLRCLIGNCSEGLVLDPFMGSGAGLRAAKDLGRNAIGVDKDPRCCEAAVEILAQEVLPLG